MKKQFFLLLALVASATMTHAAVVNGTCGDNLTWSLNTKDSTLTIEGRGEMANYDNESSTPWYEYRSYVATLNLPEGLSSIGNNAFNGCSNLAYVEVPNDVINIGNYAFSFCSNLKSIHISNSVTNIGSFTFNTCEKLTSIDIPNSVISIGSCAFYDCRYLNSVTIGNGTTSIGEHIFVLCSRLESVTIGNGITSIGNAAFEYCSSLISLTILATTPPSGGAGSGIDAGKCTLYVPAEAVEAYSNAIWWEDFKQIKAIGDGLYTVNFMDWNNQLIARRFVESGKAAIAPNAPTREGYTFIGWDKDFSNVTSDLIVTALYKEWTPANYNFLFLNGTDNSLIGSRQVDFTLPSPPDVAGFTFSKWFVVAGEFENQIIFIAVYEYTGVPTVLPAEVPVSGTTQKLIREGNVYILTDDSRTYNVTGQKVR